MSNLYPLYIIAAFSVWMPLSIGVFLYRRLKLEMRILILLFTIVAIVEGYTFYLTVNRMNVYWVHHLYAPLEYGLIALVFSCWQKNAIVRNTLRISIPLFALVCVWDIATFGNLKDLNSFTACVAYTLYVGMSSYTLVQVQNEKQRAVSKDCRFWVATALLLYSSGGIAYFAFHETVAGKMMVEIWAIHAALNIAAYILYSIGFLCEARR